MPYDGGYTMSGLLLKEFYTQRKGLLLSIIFLLFAMSLSFRGGQTLPPVYFAILYSCIFIATANTYDEKNDSDVLLNSLPVSKRQIVTSKYVASFLMAVIIIFFVLGYIAFFQRSASDQYAATLFIEAIIGLTVTGLFTAVYFPLYYLLGQRFFLFGLAVIGIIAFAAFPIVYYLGLENGFWGLADVWQQHSILFPIVLFGIATVAVLISRSISIRLYEKKEF